MTKVSAPGKLYIAGEYAITKTGELAIVAAVDRFLTAEITDSPKNQLISNQLGQLLNPDTVQHPHPRWTLMLTLLKQIKALNQALTGNSVSPITINITSNLNLAGQKLGLGSSGALVVAVLSAANKHFAWHLTSLELFKAATLTLLSLPTFARGSMGDVAAATFGGVIAYQKFDLTALNKLQAELELAALIKNPWPSLLIQPIKWPNNWQFNVGWTGIPASTQKRLKQVQIEPNNDFFHQSTQLTQKIINDIEHANFLALTNHLASIQHLLLNYTEKQGLVYLTPALRKLLESVNKFNLPAKISGAGGGDNGFAITINQASQAALLVDWQNNGILPLNLNIWF
ncbi:phosphomevalonate kinase [Weissella oryzae SG25]|uniref:phosphomevalonate kinase n=1 Tax=Weissella oryzae (strain DSM 25784 / JCM 18191 / LMG 30913 / SG25) TaxID=1329250 RepID=A0A069CSE2_WEIOS|nr:phosphomevalonate kinase [Weissella oryzae]GAK30384.1 phosphomevalonate kinase [Weissella oryzae SG25]